MKTNSKKSSITFLLLFLLILALGFTYWLTKKTSKDYDLLKPSVAISNKSALLQKHGEQELEQIIESFKNPLLIARGKDIARFSPEQRRPVREFYDDAVVLSNKIIQKANYSKDLFNSENSAQWNAAYSKTNSSQYLDFLLNAFLNLEGLTIENYLNFIEILKCQRLAIPHCDSDTYVKALSKVIKFIKENQTTKDPVLAIKILLLADALPSKELSLEVMSTFKPILIAAFHHKNKARSDQLFLSTEESTDFSLSLINLAWHYFLNKKEMPNWLYELAEKEACRLAYRLEQDGCLPNWQGGERINFCHDIYLASIVFDRDDLRYVAMSGSQAENAYPAKQKDFDFEEIGVFILRSSWNHDYSRVWHSFGYKAPKEAEDSIQVSYDQSSNRISLSVGTITQIVFDSGVSFKSLKELANHIEFSSTENKELYDYKVRIHQPELKNLLLSKFYRWEENGSISSYDFHLPAGLYHKYRSTYDIKIEELEDSKGIEINFIVNNERKY